MIRNTVIILSEIELSKLLPCFSTVGTRVAFKTIDFSKTERISNPKRNQTCFLLVQINIVCISLLHQATVYSAIQEAGKNLKLFILQLLQSLSNKDYNTDHWQNWLMCLLCQHFGQWHVFHCASIHVEFDISLFFYYGLYLIKQSHCSLRSKCLLQERLI